MRAVIAGLGLAAFLVGCTNQTSLDSATPSTTAEADEKSSANEAAAEQSPRQVAAVGEQAPAFEGLVGVDNEKHALKDYADAKAVAVVFTCNSCPVAVAYEDRLIELQNDYSGQGVQLVAINVNNNEKDRLPAMKERAEEKGFNFPYLYDPSQQVARDYGATVTPHIFVLDDQRNIAYIGPVDNSQDEAKVTEQYLRDAIDAVLAGNKPETTSVKPFGCGIKYE